jgi:tetratricopeptide (TPR) repeat protein
MKKGFWFLTIIGVFTTISQAQTLTESNYQAYIDIRFLMETQEYQQANIAIDQYLKKYPHDPFILTEKAMVMRKLKARTSEIIKVLKKSLSIYPDYYLSNYLLATTSFLQYLQNRDKRTVSQELTVLQRAIGHLKKSIIKNTDYQKSHFWLGVIIHEKGMVILRNSGSVRAKHLFEESNTQLSMANKIEPSPEAYYYMALNYEQLKNIPEKMRVLKNILTFSPYDYNTLAQLSNIYLNKKDYKMAASYLEKLALIDPDNKKISYNYLFSLFALGDTDKFLKASATINISDSPILLYAKSYFLFKKKRWRQAEVLIKSLNKNDFRSQLLLVNIYLKQYEYFKAYQIITRIKHPPSPKLFLPLYLRTLSHLNLNAKITEVFAAANRREDLVKHLDLRDYYLVFNALVQTGQSSKIPAIVEKIRKKYLKSHPALDHLPHILDHLGKNKPITAAKLEDEMNLFLAIQYLKTRRHYHQAIALLKKSVRHGRSERKMVEMASLYNQVKEFKKAENILMKLRQRHNASPTIRNVYAYFLATQKRRLKLARKMADFCLKEDGENPAYLDTLGFVLLRMGKEEEAGIYLIRAYNKNPFQPDIIDHVILYYQSINDVEKVTEIYQRAIDHDVDFKNQLMLQLKNVEKSYR